MNKEKKKKSFKLPHLLYIMLGLLLIMSLLTYVIPAGNFGLDDNGKINANAFEYLGHQTPISPLNVVLKMLDGLLAAGVTVWVVMISGANMNVVIDTGAIDEFLAYATFKLKKSSTKILVPVLYFLILYIAAFAGTDALIAVVPIGVLFAKRLKLDPMAALTATFFPSMIGFGLGPTLKVIIPQTMFNIPLLSGFGMRLIFLNLFGLVGLFFTMKYVSKVAKDPSNSLMPNDDWKKDLDNIEEEVQGDVSFPARSITVLALLIFQYVAFVAYSLNGDNIMGFITGFFIITAILIGAIGGMKADDIGNSFAKGLGDMAFVAFIIGLASTMQMVMTDGHIIDSMIYTITRPLMNLNKGLSAVGITAVITIINPIVPSAGAKAAVLIPIVEPLAYALDINAQIATQAFLFGDSFTNMISPALGWTMGALAITGVPYDKWVKWAIKPLITFVLMSFVLIYFLNAIGWTGGI